MIDIPRQPSTEEVNKRYENSSLSKGDIVTHLLGLRKKEIKQILLEEIDYNGPQNICEIIKIILEEL